MKDLKTNDDYIIALSYKEFYLEKHYQVIDDTYDAKVLYRINNRWDFDKDSYLFTNYEDYLLFHKMINSTYIDINEELFDDRYLLVAHFWSSKYSCRNLSFNSSFVASGITYFQFEAIYIPFQDFEISASYIFWLLVPQSISLDYIINYYVIYES